MYKRITCVILAIIFTLFTGCAKKNSGQSYGDELTKDTLRICTDFGGIGSQGIYDSDYEYRVKIFYEDLVKNIKSACGIEKIVFEVLPSSGAARETAIQRLQTEIMAGSGPDVFIMNTSSDSPDGMFKSTSLFNFPEKNMEAGLFLPLDEYMENSTRFTDWDAQTQAVLNAGRNDDGQLIIPLSYELPIIAYPRNSVDFEGSATLTMQNILNDPETAELGSAMYSDLGKSNAAGERTYSNRLPYILGKYADYKNDKLLFTEEDLYNAIVTMNSLNDAVEHIPFQYFEYESSYWGMIYDMSVAYFDTDMGLTTVYSMNGGVTASIAAFAAVNCNTKFPEQAFSVIDYIMQEDMQRKSELYNSYISNSLPLQNDLGQENKTLCATSYTERYLDEPNFEDLLRIKSQITAVNFENNIDSILKQLVYECHLKESVLPEDISEAYEKMERMIGE